MGDPATGGLRARKHARTRAAIVEAALALFSERGYAEVTVTDIAERAGVGRTTFFRYFPDKSDVLFGDDEELLALLLAAAEAAPRTGSTVADGLGLAGAGVLAVAHRVAAYGAAGDRYVLLLRHQDDLRARGLLKQERYADELCALLVRRGMPSPAAVLAVELAFACYRAAHRTAGDDVSRLPEDVRSALGRVGTAGGRRSGAATASRVRR